MYKSLCTAICIASLVSACGGGGATDDSTGRMGSDSTRLTLKVTDAPIDYITEVWLEFTAVEVKPVDAETPLHFDLNTPQTINLLDLTGAKSEILLNNVQVPTGDYEWIRIFVNASLDGVPDSYVRLLDGSEPELNVPSGGTTGIQLNGAFTAEASVPLNMVIDFDLRKSITQTSPTSYQFRPVLALIDESITGTILGDVPVDALTAPTCSDEDITTGNAIYLYSGNNVTPDDIDNMLPEPYTTTTISYNAEVDAYEYEIGFVPEGKYTVAFTCQSDLDELQSSEDIEFTVISTNVNVTHSTDYTNTFR